jgi:hypothetical protein
MDDLVPWGGHSPKSEVVQAQPVRESVGPEARSEGTWVGKMVHHKDACMHVRCSWLYRDCDTDSDYQQKDALPMVDRMGYGPGTAVEVVHDSEGGIAAP